MASSLSIVVYFNFLSNMIVSLFNLLLSLGPDYMSRAGPVSRDASVWAGPVVM